MAKRRKKKAGPIPVLLLTGLLAVAVYLILVNYVFVVRRVEVTGAGDLAPDDVIRLAQIPMGSPLGSLDADRIRHAVESTGQLAFEDLQTEYPDIVRLRVHERTLAAVIRNAGTLIGLDCDGCVIAQYSEQPAQDVIYVTGLSVQLFSLGGPVSAGTESFAAMCDILRGLKSVAAEALVSEVNVSDTQQLCIYSRTGIQVILGSRENMERKLQWMKSALIDLEARGETRGRLDVSSGSKADFRPR